MDTLSSHFYDAIFCWLEHKKLGKALASIKALLDELHEWDIVQEYESLCTNYHLLLNYYYEGADDPLRQQHYNGFIQQGFSLAEKVRQCHIRKNSHTEYTQLQQSIRTGGKPLHDFREWRQKKELTAATFEKLQDLFDTIWTWTETTTADQQHFRQLLSSEESSPFAQSIAISALTLSSIYYFDSKKICLLAEFTCHNNTQVRVRAVTGLVLNLIIYSNRLNFYPELKETIIQFKNKTAWQNNLFYLQQCLIGVINAPAIGKKLTEEILPKLKAGNESNNPFQIHLKTEDDSEGSPLDDKIKEIYDMYENDIDVEFYSFSHMKHFPFFRKTANWFIPFSPVNPNIPQTDFDIDSPLSLVINSNRLCDSDIYSLCLLMNSMPKIPGLSISDQLKKMKEELGVDTIHTEKQERTEKEALKAYIEDCRRFFQLASNKNEVANPFGGDLLLFHYPSLASDMLDKEKLVKLAFFAHRQKTDEVAVNIMEYIDRHYNLDKDCLQLFGFHLQKLQEYEKATLCYEKASILDTDSVWTMRNLGKCYLKTGNFHKATIIFARLYHLLPEDKNIIMRYGEALYKEDKYEKAISLFQKLEYLDNHSTKAIQAIAYCSLKSFNAPQAYRYYKKMNAQDMQPEDYRFAGHAAWCSGDFKTAVEFYRSSVGNQPITFTQEDLNILATYGICHEDALLAEDYINLPSDNFHPCS